MKKIEKRAIMCLLLAGALALGIGIFTYKYIMDGGDWATFSANRHVYSKKGNLTKGTLYDKDGTLLMSNTTGEMKFNDNYNIRKANVHLTGDRSGNISTGANKVFKDQLVGYNFLSGTYSLFGEGRDVNLTIDADICVTANNALGDRQGMVGVYNYKTGEIVCVVSSPNYDPTNPPNVTDGSTGTYYNKFFSSTFPPGSIFKLVTAAASIENVADYDTWEYTCTGSLSYGPDKVTCTPAHGTVDLEKALADSCNCYFGKLTDEKIGAKTMKKYIKKLNLSKSQNVSGIETKASTFDFPDSGLNLAWSGIGQHKDLVNPCGMMTYMGAIANGGTAVEPTIIGDVKFSTGIWAKLPWKTKKKNDMIDETTASTLKGMMRNNVEDNYGTGNFPGLNICAKSGTAEVGGANQPHAWFSGFLDDDSNPYAFIVLVENGGSGSTAAGSVANTVLQAIVK